MNTRRKRHRLSSSSSYSPNYLIMKDDVEGADDDCRQRKQQRRRSNHTLESLPPEIFEMVLRLLPLRDVAGSIRLVSRQCSSMATVVLNGAFLAAGMRLEGTMRYIKSSMPISDDASSRLVIMTHRTADSDLLAWSRALNLVELIKAQYEMLKAVTWRYTHPPSPTAKFNRVCFYAGTLIDELNSILDVTRVGPHALSEAFNSSTISTTATTTTTTTTTTAANPDPNPSPNNNRIREANTMIAGERVPIATSPRYLSFVSLCKRFMNYFEKVSECRVNRSALVSGCKAVDLLDCLAEGREVTDFRISSKRASSSLNGPQARSVSPCIDQHRMNSSGSDSSSSSSSSGRSSSEKQTNTNAYKSDSRIITMRLRYVMRRAWFTSLQVACDPDENSWREDQRFMYLRLRRLVGSVNEHYFEKVHFERDLMLLRMTRAHRLVAAHQLLNNSSLLAEYNRPPPASTYSGYGVYAGRFFYYGNMNKYAYDSKFKDPVDMTAGPSDDDSGPDEGIDDNDNDNDDDDDDDDDGDDEDDDDDEDNNNDNDNSNDNQHVNVTSRDGPAFDLVIRVELRCSIDLAPLAIISSLGTSQLNDESSLIPEQTATNLDSLYHHHQYMPEENSELYIKISITCPASSANRLPANFTWQQRASTGHLPKRRQWRRQRENHQHQD